MSDNPDEELPGEQPDDFANFDPAAYVAKHNQELGRRFGSEDPANQEVRRVHQGERRGVRGIDNEELATEHVPLGPVGRILGMFRSGEQIGLYSEILGEALPIAGRYLPIIGCVIVFLCLFVCGGGYLLINALTHR